MPARMAYRVSSARLRAPVLSLIRSRCVRTVLGVTKSVSAILALLAPPASSARICRSRADSEASWPSACGRLAVGAVAPPGKGDGFGLAERAATLAGGSERGRPERIEQPGMVTGAQSFVDGEGLSSLLI